MNVTASDTTTPALGHYAARHRRAFFLSYSHNSRFAYACRAVSPLAGQRLLDYGCGDGTFLSQVQREFPEATGVDIAADQIADCIERFGPTSAIRFATCDDLRRAEFRELFDIITCMEVLEHCPEPIMEEVLDELARLAAPGGTVLISVPIETGPTLAAKQVLRRVAGLLGIPGYQLGERYSLTEFAEMLFAGARTRIPRPVYGQQDDGRGGYHGHKGFNWMTLRQRIATRFSIQRVTFTPWPWLGRWSNSQVWFHCRKRTDEIVAGQH